MKGILDPKFVKLIRLKLFKKSVERCNKQVELLLKFRPKKKLIITENV